MPEQAPAAQDDPEHGRAPATRTLGADPSPPTDPSLPTGLAARLLEWFEREGRSLPWRTERTPYRALVAELMLQQTQVSTALPYFERWMARFPDAQSLAEAALDDVLKTWEGLGYYARARNLHRAAQVICDNGVFPSDYGGWLKLPGVGPYTAAALASMLEGERVVAIDGNLRRVAARLFALEGALTNERARAALEPHLSRDRSGDFNEALMDLGATVCTPKTPACARCPLAACCLAFRTGRVHALPTPKPKLERPHRKRYAVVDLRDGKLWLRRRGENEMLAGLWGFALVDEVSEPPSETAARLPPVEHAYTHFSTAVTPILMSSAGLDGTFVPVGDLATLALSSLDHKLLARLREAGLLPKPPG